MSIASYSFLPYLRQGIANNVQSSGEARGTFTIKLEVHGDATSAPVDGKAVELYGPGDIVGIDVRAIVKTDPHQWITNLGCLQRSCHEMQLANTNGESPYFCVFPISLPATTIRRDALVRKGFRLKPPQPKLIGVPAIFK